MSKVKEIPCVVCPMSCELEITINDDGKIQNIEGNRCKRGLKYGESEVLNPVRTITSTIKVSGGLYNVCPVRTDGEIPKEHIFKCMEEINKASVKAPIKIGQVIIENVVDTGVKVIATRDMPAD
jgi:CxxC motif-containing protein